MILSLRQAVAGVSGDMMAIKTNDLKTGTEIALRNGYLGTLVDSRKGNTRMAEVKGIVTERGSVYAHDILKAKVNGQWVMVEHTEAQQQLRKTIGKGF